MIYLRGLTAFVYAVLAITFAVNVVIFITVQYVGSAPVTFREHGRCRRIRASRGAFKLSANLAHYCFLLLPSSKIKAIVNMIPNKNPNQKGLTYILFTSEYNV